jgi:hypothetical protein
MQAVPVTVHYESFTEEGERTVKSAESELYLKPGDSRVKAINDVIAFGFRLELSDGRVKHIPPGKIIQLVYNP